MEDNLMTLQTEVRNINSMDIAENSVFENVRMMNKEDEKCAKAVQKRINEISRVIEICVETLKNKGHIYFLGCAHSGLLGALDVFEANAQFGCVEEFIPIIAGNTTDVMKIDGKAEDSEENAIIDIKDRHVDQNDFVICITASGRTPYVVSALRYLKSQKIKSALIVNNDNSIAEKYTDYPIIIIPGPEVITGSTRLKSGTCTKMVLNMVTTITMAKIGRTYSNLMIKVNPCSNKMEQRLEYIMQQATGCTKDKAKDLLIQTNYDISLAIIMQIKNIGIVKAKERLKNYNNNVNEACK